MPELLTLAFLEGVLNTFVVIAGIGLLIFVHELGHFLVAKWNKVRVEAFSLGFGPVIWGFRRGDTHYRLSLIPLGGYVKMAGETPGDEHTDDPAEFQNQPILARAAILVAGVVMNALVAFVLFVVAFRVGVPLIQPVVGGVDPGQPAWKAGIRPGDRIEKINGTKIIDFADITEEIAFADGAVDLVVVRDGERIEFQDVPTFRDASRGVQVLGFVPPIDPVVDVEEGSPAWKAGLRPGDEVQSAGGVDLSDARAFQRAFQLADGPIPYTVRRDGELLTFEVTPTSKPSAKLPPRVGISPVQGRIAGLKPGSLAEAAGFREGDEIAAVNGTPAPSLRAARDLAGQLESPVVFTVRRDGKEVRVGPVTGPGSPSEWEAFFRGVSEDYTDANSNIVSLSPDYQFEDGNPARGAGMPEGARIVAVNGKETPDFESIRKEIADTPEDEPISVTWIAPGSEERTGPVEITRRVPLVKRDGVLFANATEKVKLDGIGEAAAAGLRKSVLTGKRILQMLGGIFSGRVSAKNLGGPVMIFDISYKTADRDIMHFLYFLGILSVNLAILNILPIPVLDGGHLLFILIEAIRRKPLSEQSMAMFQWAGFLFLILLMAFVIVQDISRYL